MLFIPEESLREPIEAAVEAVIGVLTERFRLDPSRLQDWGEVRFGSYSRPMRRLLNSIGRKPKIENLVDELESLILGHRTIELPQHHECHRRLVFESLIVPTNLNHVPDWRRWFVKAVCERNQPHVFRLKDSPGLGTDDLFVQHFWPIHPGLPYGLVRTSGDANVAAEEMALPILRLCRDAMPKTKAERYWVRSLLVRTDLTSEGQGLARKAGEYLKRTDRIMSGIKMEEFTLDQVLRSSTMGIATGISESVYGFRYVPSHAQVLSERVSELAPPLLELAVDLATLAARLGKTRKRSDDKRVPLLCAGFSAAQCGWYLVRAIKVISPNASDNRHGAPVSPWTGWGPSWGEVAPKPQTLHQHTAARISALEGLGEHNGPSPVATNSHPDAQRIARGSGPCLFGCCGAGVRVPDVFLSRHGSRKLCLVRLIGPFQGCFWTKRPWRILTRISTETSPSS